MRGGAGESEPRWTPCNSKRPQKEPPPTPRVPKNSNVVFSRNKKIYPLPGNVQI